MLHVRKMYKLASNIIPKYLICFDFLNNLYVQFLNLRIWDSKCCFTKTQYFVIFTFTVMLLLQRYLLKLLSHNLLNFAIALCLVDWCKSLYHLQIAQFWWYHFIYKRSRNRPRTVLLHHYLCYAIKIHFNTLSWKPVL